MDEVTEILRTDNPSQSHAVIAVYRDALVAYHRAQAEIRRQGPIVLNPRTSEPMDNPHLKLAERAAATLLKIKRITSNWANEAAERLAEEAAEQAERERQAAKTS